MSATQLAVSEQFIQAMGPMLSDQQKVHQVMQYIKSLRQQPPCQFSCDAVVQLANDAIANAEKGLGMSHTQAKQVATSWQ